MSNCQSKANVSMYLSVTFEINIFSYVYGHNSRCNPNNTFTRNGAIEVIRMEKLSPITLLSNSTQILNIK